MAKPHDLPYLPAGFELENELLDQLSVRPGHARCVVGRDELLLIVHNVPKPGISEREAVAFWRKDDGLWLDAQGAKGLRRLADLIERFDAAIKSGESIIENATKAAEVFALARIAGPLARSSRDLAQAVDQALNQDEDSRELRALRDRAREVERAADLLFQDARLKLEFWQAERAEAQQASTDKLSRTVFQLSLLAGLFLPVATLAGLFGMNGGPRLGAVGFWLIFLAALGTGAFVLAMVAKNHGKNLTRWKD